MQRFVYGIPLVFLSIYVTGSHAVDMNGYTAQYECRAGRPHCNIDVTALGKRACDQIITASTSWSSINWSNNTICLQAGDHTAKGDLVIPSSANGGPQSYKVLRYYRPGDSDDEPWQQSSAEQAKLRFLRVSGDYWLIHRLTFPGISSNNPTLRIENAAGSGDVKHIVYNRLLVEGNREKSNYYGLSQNCSHSWNYNRITVQNSVFRNVGPWGSPHEAVAIDFNCGSNLHAVNNEIYDWVSHPIQLGYNALPTMEGIVVENNDLYVTPALHTADGRAKSESPLSIKLKGASSTNPTRIIHNRIWGARWTNLNYCCNGESGQAITNYNENQHLLVQNNIIGESQIGSFPSNRSSWIGNIFYSIKQYYSAANSHVLQWGGNTTEIYLNTVVNNTSFSFSFGGQRDGDVRCNVLVNASGRDPWGGAADSSFQVDHNTFYASPVVSYNGSNTNIVNSVKTRANNTNYRVGDIVRVDSIETCTTNNDISCFLYRVTVAGTSASSRPSYCTTLGCTIKDGTVALEAIRGPYTFYRKLRTGPERYTIPYAAVHALAPEAYACPKNF